jgi:hypothetical protein
MSHKDKILEYLKSNSRNKLIFHRDDIPEINYVDIGKSLAADLEKKSNNKRLSFIAKEKLNELMNKNIVMDAAYGNILAIKNVGILFEKDLKFDFINYIENFSKSIPIFIEWKGEYDDENLYFHSREKGLKLNIKNLSHIFL